MTNYLIVEDEHFAYKELERMMHELRPGYMLMGRTETIEQTIAFLQQNEPDLILLDIRLADGSCFDIFEHITVSTPVIFTTSYDEHAIQAFKVNSIDYLLKPIEDDDLQAALNKFEQVTQVQKPIFSYEKIERLVMGDCTKTRFLIQKGEMFRYVKTDEIAFAYCEDKAIFLHTFSGKRHIINYTLDQMEKQLDKKKFFRISRNCITNIESVHAISKYFNSRLKVTFQPTCPLEVLVSRARVTDFLNWIDGGI